MLRRDKTATSGNWTAPAPNGNGSQLSKPHGPPYASTMAIVGGEPSPAVDDPIAVVLLVLFLLSAAAHLAVLRINRQRNLKFVFSGMLFALCLLRGVSLVARMIWASYPKAVDALIAASVMTQAGSVLIFIINLFFAQRVLRAYHPRLGWHRGTRGFVWFLIACVLCCLVMAIVATIHSFYTLDTRARRADRAVQLFAGLYLAFLAFLPVPVVGLAAAAQHARRFRFHRVEKFGEGRWRNKVGLLVFASLVATLGAAFRVGVNFDGRPSSKPAWFHSKACYYGFNFVTDLVVSTAYLLARFDRRFIVPDGAQGPGDYSPIVPSMHSTTSNSNLVGKLPIMGARKTTTTIRSPLIPTTPTPTPTPSPPTPTPPPQQSTTPSPSSSQSQRNNSTTTSAYHTDSSNTAVHTSSSLDQKQPSLSPDPLPLLFPPQPQPQPQPQPHRPALRTRNRGRRAIMLRMRINSEADAYGPDCGTEPLVGSGSGEEPEPGEGRRSTSPSRLRAPAPAHLGPPILPALDLDLELLSATLLAPWALDSWGFETGPSRRGSRSGLLRNGSRSSRSGGGSGNSSSSRNNVSGGDDGNSEGGSRDVIINNAGSNERNSSEMSIRSGGGRSWSFSFGQPPVRARTL
ncbi:hypothetical protein F5Y00DRAFT_272532 [Daldinia vernicosa]|uniref:uncharacterized protein n=1 Tax=Daldinia vernicosa TaxID=114800 RepID=UPI002007563E|nr:uncharacterized protein F5Y00DRAFT_272532 [Daldinia vernicosa]KAI0852965.1 hypothetical protein F5Y00DRAFT_272532 [Daldinia vernicosa]